MAVAFPISANLSHPQFGAAISDNFMTAASKRCGLALIFSSIMMPMV
jgi:hypothetical protein